MTTTNMCSNFGCLWDSPPLGREPKVVGERENPKITQKSLDRTRPIWCITPSYFYINQWFTGVSVGKSPFTPLALPQFALNVTMDTWITISMM